MKIRTLVGIGITLLLLFAADVAFAGVMEVIKSAAGSGQIWVGIGTVVLLYIFKRIPNNKIYNVVFKFFKGFGIGCTAGLNRYKWSAPFWEAHIESWFIDFLQNTVGAALNGYIEGLRTNNAGNGGK